MSNQFALSSSSTAQGRKRKPVLIACLVALLLAGGIALDTKVVKLGSADDVRQQGFSMEKYGPGAFPEIQQSVESRAVDANALATQLKADRQKAIEEHGVGSPLPVFAVTLTGKVEQGSKGIYTLAVADAPSSLRIRLQTGPAITGTDLRDATGKIQFGDFKNQIEYQNAGSAINQAMKAQVLAPLDTTSLSGKSLKVTGVFRLLNPDNWLVTPVKIEVQQ